MRVTDWRDVGVAVAMTRRVERRKEEGELVYSPRTRAPHNMITAVLQGAAVAL
jgi:hypothetical protein